MPRTIKTPDGMVHIFPDEATDADISKALKSIMPPPTWAEQHPNMAGAARGVLDTLPAVGAMVGGALATPETLGTGTIAGVALGAGAGRGLRDLIAEGFSLDKPSSPAAKAGHIALDTTEAAAAQALLPGIWEAIKTPGKTIGEIIDLLPSRLRPSMPGGLAKAPARILERPAWQTWQTYVEPESTATPQTTSTAFNAPRLVTAPSESLRSAPSPMAPAETLPSVAPPLAARPVAGPSVPAPAPATPAVTPSKTGPPAGTAMSKLWAAMEQAGVRLPAQDMDTAARAIAQGQDAGEVVQALMRLRNMNQPSAFAGLPSDAEVAARVAERNRTGVWPR